MESDGDDSQEHETVIIAAEDYEEEYSNSLSATHMTVVHTPQIIGAVRHINPITTSSPKGKYYKQTYRHAWENMPDFKGWLREVPGEPTRAFCIYCQKTLHAHRLSLLKHTCTMRHQKAAQIHKARKNKQNNFEILVQNTTSENETAEEQIIEHQIMDEESFLTEEVEEAEHEQDGEDEEEENIQIDAIQSESMRQARKAVAYQCQKMLLATQGKVPISTHVTDTMRGTPIQGLQVSLYKLIEGRWTFINEGNTNGEGRFWNFMETKDFSTGRYKMHFDVDRYFEAKKQETIYPFVEIIFDCKSLLDHYHIPLLLSPFGYTTYRGN